MPKRLCIQTVGCQMNQLDSELVAASLRKRGFELVDDPQEAEVILLNTCSVREHAEEKVYSLLGQLKHLKRMRPRTVMGVLGCMAQREQRRIFERAPHVDLIVGPGQLRQVADLVELVQAGGGRQEALSRSRQDGSLAEIKRSHEPLDALRDPAMRPTPFQAYLRIQIGCDKFCTYCVVPMTRGPEQCRPPGQILEEARTLADQGCKEITLLGQTVNSYRYHEGAKTTRLQDLLYALHRIEGIQRIKFVTNHPRDMTRDLLQAMRDLPHVAPYLHVPAQSGSNRILQRMRRGYTAEWYREMLALIREMLPHAAVSSDFLVGFCGETDDDFEQTRQLVRDARFKNSFIFKYSERPGTRGAERYPDDVPYRVKQRRNNELLALQDAISDEDNRRLVGRTFPVLVEGPSRRALQSSGGSGPLLQMTGRTPCDRIVVFDGSVQDTGRILPITIRAASGHTLFGSTPADGGGPHVAASRARARLS